MISRLKLSKIILFTIINTSIIILANKSNENCSFDLIPHRYHCHNINEAEWIEAIENADERFIKCTDCTLETLPLQKLQLKTRQKLKTLTVKNVTNVLKVDENTFKDCSQLEDIELQNLSIEEIKPEYLAPLEDLEDLIFINVNIKIKNKDTFKFLKNLEKLQISGAKLQSINSEPIQYLTDLEIFDVSDNDIETIAPDTFKNNLKLKEINFYKNYLTILPLNLFDNLKKLKFINLSDNPIINFNFEHILTTNRKLKYLFVYDIPCPTFKEFEGPKCKSTINKNITTTIAELNKQDEFIYDRGVAKGGSEIKCEINCVPLKDIEGWSDDDLYKVLYFKELGVTNKSQK